MSLKNMILDLVKSNDFTKEQAILHLDSIKNVSAKHPEYKLLETGEYEEIKQAILDLVI